MTMSGKIMKNMLHSLSELTDMHQLMRHPCAHCAICHTLISAAFALVPLRREFGDYMPLAALARRSCLLSLADPSFSALHFVCC